MSNPSTEQSSPTSPSSPTLTQESGSQWPTQPRRRVIVLGASNVTRSFGTLVATARAVWNEPLEIIAAHGHGRSYGADWSRVLLRKLPGILSCGLWNSLSHSASTPTSTAAIVTDIGNDILYEYDVPTIAGWIEQCLDRLAAINAQTIVTGLPIENIFKLSEVRYKIFRTLLMPGCTLRLSDTAQRAIDLNDCVRALVESRGMTMVSPSGTWYGLDPIHVRFRHYPIAWREVLGEWQTSNKNREISRGKLIEAILLRSRIPARVRWCNREFGAPQPCAKLNDGSTVALY